MNRKLILVRHGQSTYNLENRFTGWKDVPLTEKGVREAKKAGDTLKQTNIVFDIAYTSKLKRAQNTLNIILEQMDINLDIVQNEALNERDYGDLIGQNKVDAAKKFGSEQVQIWRRSFDVPPPGGESLKMTCDRTLPYFKEVVMKNILENDSNVLLSAHGNSIRAIVKDLFQYDAETILKTEIGWCEPWYFQFDQSGTIIDFSLLGVSDIDQSNSHIPLMPIIKENCK